MKTTFKALKRIISILWQLPQDLVGALIKEYLEAREGYTKEWDEDGVTVFVSEHFSGGISLGHFVILSESLERADNRLKRPLHLMHELGHCKQSEYLGWLYLLVIGLPSIVWATIHTYCKRIADKYDYYSFYTEKWANKLGGVA